MLEEPDQSLLEKLHLVQGRYLTHAAALMFHPEPERFFTGASVKIGAFENDANLRHHDEVQGDLITQVNQTLEVLKAKYLRALISYEGVQRVETWPMPMPALREAVLNAVAHKDYASGNPIQIRVYSDKLMIWNQGQLPPSWTLEKLLGTHASVPFNPAVANVFFRAGMIEAWGRGIERMMEACRGAGTPEPIACRSSRPRAKSSGWRVRRECEVDPEEAERLLRQATRRYQARRRQSTASPSKGQHS